MINVFGEKDEQIERVRIKLKGNISRSEGWDHFFNMGPNKNGTASCFVPNENDKGSKQLSFNAKKLPSLPFWLQVK